MNWNKIQDDNPRTFQKLANWEFNNEYIVEGNDNTIRLLFDFFDEQGIYVVIDLYFEDENKMCWEYCIERDIVSDDEYGSRQEAEMAGVTKAFEVLETKLKEREPQGANS